MKLNHSLNLSFAVSALSQMVYSCFGLQTTTFPMFPPSKESENCRWPFFWLRFPFPSHPLALHCILVLSTATILMYSFIPTCQQVMNSLIISPQNMFTVQASFMKLLVAANTVSESASRNYEEKALGAREQGRCAAMYRERRTASMNEVKGSRQSAPGCWNDRNGTVQF